MPSHVQLLQIQVKALNERLSKLEASHRDGHDAVGAFADRLVEEDARLDQRLTGVEHPKVIPELLA